MIISILHILRKLLAGYFNIYLAFFQTLIRTFTKVFNYHLKQKL